MGRQRGNIKSIVKLIGDNRKMKLLELVDVREISIDSSVFTILDESLDMRELRSVLLAANIPMPPIPMRYFFRKLFEPA